MQFVCISPLYELYTYYSMLRSCSSIYLAVFTLISRPTLYKLLYLFSKIISFIRPIFWICSFSFHKSFIEITCKNKSALIAISYIFAFIFAPSRIFYPPCLPAVSQCHAGCAEVDSLTEAVAGEGFLLRCISCKRREEVPARATVDWHFKPLGEEEFRHVSPPISLMGALLICCLLLKINKFVCLLKHTYTYTVLCF